MSNGDFLKTREGWKNRGLPSRPEQAVGQRVRFAPGCAAAYNSLRDPAQILDQNYTQSDSHGPELADRQWLHALIRRHKTAKRFGVKPAVGMRYKCPRHSKYARIALQVARGEFRQFAVIAGRQIVLNLAKLFIHDVEVINQPLRGGRDGMLLLNRPSDGAIGFQQHPTVVDNAGDQKAAPPGFFFYSLSRGKALRVLLQPFQAEQFGTDRFFRVGKKNGRSLVAIGHEYQ